MTTVKAGCYLVDTKTKCIALIYREHLNDFSFPKGHLEPNESLEDCAVRETAEETKRDAQIVKNIPPIIERYTTPKGEKCECHMFVAVDIGKSDNTSADTHDLIWTPIEDVENKLSYDGLKKHWMIALPKIMDFLK